MNSLHLLRLITPFGSYFTKKLISEPQIYLLSKWADKALLVNKSESQNGHYLTQLPFQSEIKIMAKPEEEEENDQPIDNSDLKTSSRLLTKNIIDNRIKSLQYAANDPCEDSIAFGQLHCLKAYTVSVFDGHGGSLLAEYSKTRINQLIDTYLKDHLQTAQDISDVFKNALTWSYKKLEDNFFQIYQEQLRIGNRKIRNVGTCGITVIVHNNRVYVGNSGDSQGMFILSEDKLIRTQKINQRLSVNNKLQRQRLMQKWKDLDEQIISEESGHNFYLKGRLQPTRTIGDYYLKKEQYYDGQGQYKGPYLQCEPDIREFKLTPAHKYMVIASDGVWDVLSRHEVMGSLMNGRQIDLNQTCYQQQIAEEEESPYIGNTLECVLKKCCEFTGKSLKEVKGMQKGRRRKYHDDISIVIVDLQQQL